MQYGKRAGIVIFAILIAVALLDTIIATPLAISDTDFSTYVAVPLVMLPLFALFMLKERMVPRVGKRDIAIGIALFAALAVAMIALRVGLSYLFLSMKVQMLIFPLFIASMAFLLFGSGNVQRFKYIMAYAIFASPTLLLWLSSASPGFVEANTMLVYGVVSHIFSNVAYTAPITISANGHSLGIGSSCVGLGILIGTIMFLAPLAYLYDGKASRKALWVASGVGLVLLLNVLRMLGITIAWFFYGPNNAILTIHIFAGVLLFYVSIIAMILLAGRYGLAFPARERKARREAAGRGSYALGIALAIVFATVYAALGISYPSAQAISPVTLYNHIPYNSAQVSPLLSAAINESSFSEYVLQNNLQNTIIMEATNATYNRTDPVAIVIVGENRTETAQFIENATILGEETFLDSRGLTATVYLLASGGNRLLFYSQLTPFALPGGSATLAQVYGAIPDNLTRSGISCSPDYDGFYTAAANLFNAYAYNSSADGRIMSGFCIVQDLVRG